MKFKFYCVAVIVGAIFCFNVVAMNDPCLERYLTKKGKWPASDNPKTDDCTSTVIFFLAIATGMVEDIFDSHAPNNAECLKKEFRNAEISDLFIKLTVVEESQSSKSDKETAMSETRSEIKQNLIEVARLCEANANALIEIFRHKLGMINLTKTDEDYCLAKYVADKELLPLEGVNLDPYGNVTANVDCDAVALNQVHRVTQPKNYNLANPIECVVESYRRNNAYDALIVFGVLKRFEQQIPITEAKINEAVDRLERFESDVYLCDNNQRTFLSDI